MSRGSREFAIYGAVTRDIHRAVQEFLIPGSYSARYLNSTFWEVISVFDSWFLVLFLSDIEPYNFVENFFHAKLYD